MATFTTKIKSFAPGMSADLRSSTGFARVQGFRVFLHKLVPQFSTESDENKALNVQRFMYAPWLASGGYALFGYGVTSTSRPAVFIKGSTTGDIIADSWGTPQNGDAAGSGARDTRVFFWYKGYFHGFAAGTRMWRYGKTDDASSKSFNDTYQSISYANLADPLHHTADDCAYFPVDNKIYRLNGSTWDGLVLTLPDNMVITSLDADGDFLQIACKSKGGLADSWTFQWDRNSSLETITAKAGWGRGNLMHIANLQGTIIGVVDRFTLSSLGHSVGKIAIKALISGVAKTIAEYEVDGLCYFEGNKFVADDKLHFPFELARDGSYIHGIFSVDALGQLRVEISEPEADGGTAGLRYQGIYRTGEYWWIAHSNDGSVNRTDDQANYGTGILETNIISGPTSITLKGASVPCEPLPSGGSIVLNWRKKGDTSWTTVKPTKAPATGDTAIHFLKDTNGKPPSGDEVQYQLVSTGGAVITATEENPIEFMHETVDKKAYG